MVGVVSVDEVSLVEGIVGDDSELEEEEEEEDDVSLVVGVVSVVEDSVEEDVVSSEITGSPFGPSAATESSFIAAALLC